jgi:rRNA maturation endonuclease Nob1
LSPLPPLNLQIKVKGENNMKSENKARCEACGKRLRRDEGKVCRVCIGKVAKLLNSYKKGGEFQK